MKRFKKNRQYRWFSKKKNTDMDDNPLTDILVVPNQNVNNSPALNEAVSTHGGVENESPNQGKLNSVTMEDPNEWDDNPLTDILVVPNQNVNNSPALNEAVSTHGGVENESPNQGKLNSVTMEDPNEWDDNPLTDILVVPNQNVNNSSQPKESTSITYVESINDNSQPKESTSITFVESINDNSQPKESTSITFVESINDKPNTEELTYENYEEAPSTMTSIYEYGSLHVDGATSEVTAQSDLKTSPSERISVSTPLSQSTVISVDEDVDETSKMKNTTRLIVSAFAFRVFGILLIFVDIFLIMSDVIFNDNKIVFECHSISLAIALFFFFDVLLRVYVEGRKTYFTDLFNILDAVIIAITLLIDTIYFFFDLRFLKDVPRVAVLLRPLRLIILVRVFHLAYQNRQLQKLTRRLVSENKRRYRRDGFDLDLTYITDRIIAMSFPSSGKQSFYRNPIKEVVRFLDTKHRNHYRVYNLCSERAYNPEHFHNRVQRIMIDDHNVPTLSEMVVFSKEVNMWLAQDKKNVVVIHCKGGKGRTGTMVCACLIGNQIFGTAKESLAYFASRRTDHTISSKFQGIETPSQSRYVGYFENVKNLCNWTLPPKKILTPYKIIIYSIHNVGKGDGSDLKIQITTKQQTVFSCSSSKNCKIFHDVETDKVIIELLNCPILYDDVKVRFLSRVSNQEITSAVVLVCSFD
nr:phosphatidylinositol 3,4,5-trisphosphate 3-phosphatase TPTE2-like isoform X33 [Oryctolagus cuniculus]XP_051696856.1 phosphatidylinositol 3,4,5-trisphosphate 3-phosphatase TPTE2-like isoform X34 [Oryctolagus cuniculus]